MPISHTLLRSAFVQDAWAIARRCREAGAILLLDVYQSAGVLPLELEAWGVHAATGGSVKWLCGGPGAGYLWVNPEIAETLQPLALTNHLIQAAEEAGFEVRTPRDPRHRGGTVSIWHEDAERLCHELIDREIICDYRPRAGIRLSPHFYNTEAELDHAIATLRQLAS